MKNFASSEKIRQKEEIFGAFAAVLAEKTPLKYKPLIFASPVSVRDPDEGGTWHPYYVHLPWVVKFVFLGFYLIGASIAGIIKIIIKKGFRYFLSLNEKHKILIVATDEVVSFSVDGSLTTSYINVRDISEVDWLIMAYSQRAKIPHPKEFSLSRREILRINYTLFKDAFNALYQCFRSELDKKIFTEAVLLYLSWVAYQGWLSIFALREVIQTLVSLYDYKWVFSPHEMLPYSRTVWFLAKEHGIESVAIQHALIYRNKFEFFPTQPERSAGLKTPDIFFVYSTAYSSLLKPYMPSSRFILGASRRFGEWKRLKENHLILSGNRNLLVVSSACWFDINMMIECIKRLTRDRRPQREIRLRLHPSARYTIRDLFRIRFLKWIGMVKFSNQTLKQDLENARLVIGCGSSVIFEAILSGIPTLIIQDDRFSNFDPSSMLRHNITMKADEFNWDAIEKIPEVADLAKLQKDCIDLLGIDKEEVDTLTITNLTYEKELLLK